MTPYFWCKRFFLTLIWWMIIQDFQIFPLKHKSEARQAIIGCLLWLKAIL